MERTAVTLLFLLMMRQRIAKEEQFLSYLSRSNGLPEPEQTESVYNILGNGLFLLLLHENKNQGSLNGRFREARYFNPYTDFGFKVSCSARRRTRTCLSAS